MTDRPIIFSGPMVRALLEGRKTQTRRIAPRPRFDAEGCHPAGVGGPWWDFWSTDRAEVHRFKLPYAHGDRLYVRESHALVPSTAYRFSPGVPYAVNDEDGSQACVYRDGWERSKPGTGWRPSIHMPRWASRITLTVTDVRVQRLQEISETDAIAEGVEYLGEGGPNRYSRQLSEKEISGGGWFNAPTAREVFSSLWNSLHGPDAWDANPWVVAVSFTVDRQNIDHLPTNP